MMLPPQHALANFMTCKVFFLSCLILPCEDTSQILIIPNYASSYLTTPKSWNGFLFLVRKSFLQALRVTKGLSSTCLLDCCLVLLPFGADAGSISWTHLEVSWTGGTTFKQPALLPLSAHAHTKLHSHTQNLHILRFSQRSATNLCKLFPSRHLCGSTHLVEESSLDNGICISPKAVQLLLVSMLFERRQPMCF